MALDQRPLSIGEILDRTAALYRRNFLPLVSITAPPAAAMILIFGVFALFFVTRLNNTKAAPDPTSAMILGALLLLFGLLAVPLLLGITAVSLGASNHAVLCAHRGEKITIRASYRYAFSRFWRLVWLLCIQSTFAWIIPGMIFTVIAIAVGIGVAVAPSEVQAQISVILVILLILGILCVFAISIWLWIRMSLACPAVVAQDLTAWQAVKRSNSITKGTRGRIFVMFLLIWVLVMAVSLVLIAPVDIAVALFFHKELTGGQPPTTFATVLQITNLCIDFAVRTLVMPIYAISLMLFYFDQRTRLEGYDIELLMARAGWDDLPAAPPPSFEPPTPLQTAEPVPESALEPSIPEPEPAPEPASEPAAPEPGSGETSNPEATGD